MNTYLTFISNDLKIIFRDKTLIVMVFLPIIFILLCRLLVPYLASYISGMDEYYWLVLASFCVLSGSTPAFLSAFLMLDERDENLVPVLKVIPLPFSMLIGYRISFLMISSFTFSVIFLLLNGLVAHSLFKIVLSSILVSFIPAILILLILPFAKNKIEGLSLFKGFNTLLFIPIVAFFVPRDWQYLFGIIPFYWVFDILHAKTSISSQLISFFFGLVINVGYFYLLILFFNKKFVNEVKH